MRKITIIVLINFIFFCSLSQNCNARRAKNVGLSYLLGEYLSIKGTGASRSTVGQDDKEILENIKEMGRDGIIELEQMLKQEGESWMRGKILFLLGKLYEQAPDKIFDILYNSALEDESILVRSIVIRGIFPEINSVVSEDQKNMIDSLIQEVDLNPWAEEDGFRILDAGCQFGEATHGIAEYYKKQNFKDIKVVGVDNSVASIIEAERNKKDKDIIFVYGDVNEHEIDPADVVISKGLLIYTFEITEHVESLLRQVNSDGGRIYFSPSGWNTYVDDSGEDGFMRFVKFKTSISGKLPHAEIMEFKWGDPHPFGGDYIEGDFGSPWGAGYGWIMADIPSGISINTEQDDKIWIRTNRFPDDEFHLRILNPGEVKDADVNVESGLESSDDIVRLILTMDMLKLYGANNVNLILDENYDMSNGLDKVLRFYCDGIFYKDGVEIREIDVPLLDFVKKNEVSVWIDKILYQHNRFESDAKEAAEDIDSEYERIQIEKSGNNPLSWKVNLSDSLKNKDVILIHSTENSIDFVELWLMLVELRRIGVSSISVLDTYTGYSRQDKIFRDGEGISAKTMLKIADVLTDDYMTFNVHYEQESGQVQIEDFEVYNLNAFIQLSEFLLDFIVDEIQGGRDKITEEFRNHPLLLIAPDSGAAGYVSEAANLLGKYIGKKYDVDVEVQWGYLDKKRIGDREVTMSVEILDKKGEKINKVRGVDLNECWAFILDDETSSGVTLLTAGYTLVEKLGFSWQRVLSAVVHGKLADGLDIFHTGWDEKEIRTAVAPKEDYIDDNRNLMPPRIIVVTKSVSLPVDFPEDNKVSIESIISYAIQHVIGGKSKELHH